MSAHAEKCPICEGKGFVEKELVSTTTFQLVKKFEECHGCDGKGWIAVVEKDWMTFPSTLQIV
jgi:DnaJ-class molecular chaperone